MALVERLILSLSLIVLMVFVSVEGASVTNKASRDPASTPSTTTSQGGTSDPYKDGAKPEERCENIGPGFTLQNNNCVGEVNGQKYTVDADDTSALINIRTCSGSLEDCITQNGGFAGDRNIGVKSAQPPSNSSGTGSGKSASGDLCTYEGSPTLDKMTCNFAMGSAQMACEDPTKTKVSPADSAAASKAGVDTQSILTMLGGGAATLAAASAGSDVSKQCEAAKEVAKLGKNLQIAYAGACSAAIAFCATSCGSASSSAKSYLEYLKDSNKPATCTSRSAAIAKAESLYNTASGFEDKCYGYGMKVTQSASAIAQYQMQIQAQGNCEQNAQNQIPAECLNNPNAYKIDYCNDIRCKDATFKASNPSICTTTTLVDCSLSANASSPTCICQTNPSAAGCAGTAITESTPKGTTTTASLNDDLINGKGVDFNASTAGSNGYGGSTAGSNTGSGGLSSPNLGGGGLASGRAGAQGADANIERGYRTGGYSVSGVPLSGGGNGNGQKGPGEGFNLAKFLPKGKGKDAFRSLAGMQTVGLDGITCANCATLFQKVSTQYRKQTPSLRP